MLSLVLGYCPSLIRELESACAGGCQIETYGNRRQVGARLGDDALPRPNLLFYDLDALSGSAAVRLIKSARSSSSRITIIGITQGRSVRSAAVAGTARKRKMAPVPDFLLTIPEDLPRLRDIITDAGSAAEPVAGSLELHQRLAAAQLRMQGILDRLTEGVAVIDSFGTVTRVNRKLVEILGARDASEFLGKRCHEALWRLPGTCRACPRFTEAPIEETRTLRQAESMMHIDVCAARLADASGATIGVIESIRDATPRLRLEQSLIESEKMKAIGMIAAGLAHELRNPLAIISATADYCLQVAEDPDVCGGLESIANAVQSADKIIRDLLNFARPAPDHFEPVSVGAMVHSTVGMLAAECRKRGVDVNVDLPCELPPVRADRGKLQQALLNFTLNGVEAMDEGGTLTITARPTEGRTVEIEIADTGRGLAPDELERVFEPFFSTKTGGVGLGMPISRKIIEAHEGHVRIDSSPGKGATVRIALPAAMAVEHKAVGIA